MHDHATSGAPIFTVIRTEQEQGQEADNMRWPYPDEEPAIMTIMLSERTVAEREAIRWVRAREAKLGAGVWMWWTEG
jgi:hypothetical protein